MSDEEVIQQVIAALNTINDPRVTSQQRQQANEFCEKIKESPGCYNVGIYLAQADKSDLSKYFGLQLLEHMVKTKWYVFTAQQKDQMKQDALNILARGTKDLLVEQQFIKEQVATMVVEIAKRDWPQQWEDLLNNLVQISLLGNTQAELVLMVLRTLPDEIVVFNDTTQSSNSTLSEQRKKDLMAGINQGLQALFNFFYSLLEKNFSTFLAVKATDAKQAQISQKLIDGVLRTLLSYLEWAPISFIFDTNLQAALCQLLKETATRLSACECLLVVLSRKLSQQERTRMTFPFDYFPLIADSINVSSGDFETDYNYHKRLGQTLTFLGTNLLKVAPTKEKLPPNFERFLHVMLAFSNHPSILLSSYTIPFWLAAYQSDTVFKLDFFSQLQLHIMKMAETKMLKVGDPEKENSPGANYSLIDFGTTSEFQKFQAMQRARLNEFVKSLATKQPDVCLEYCAIRLPELISTQIPTTKVDMTDPAYLAFEAYTNFLLSAMNGIPSEILTESKEQTPPPKVEVEVEDVTKQKTIAFIEAILKFLLEYNSNHLMIIQTQMNCIQALTPYYGKNPAALGFVLGKVLPFATFRQPEEPMGTQFSLDTLSLRRKAIHTITHIGGHIPVTILAYLPKLLTEVQAMTQQGLLLDSEKVFFAEALVMISNGMKNFDKQSSFLQGMMANEEAEWNSADISTAFSSPQMFLLYIGAVAGASESQQIYEERRKKIQNMVNMFHAIYKRVSVPSDSKEAEEGGYGPHIAHGMSFSSRWPVSQHHLAVLPNVLKLIKTLHALWVPEIKNSVPAEYQPMYAMDDPAVMNIIGKATEYKRTGDQTLRYLRNVLDACRDGCYNIIGNAAVHGEEFWTMNGITEALITSVGSHLEFIENRHLRLLLKNFGESFVQNCPDKLRSSLLDQVLPHLFGAVYSHLNVSYNEIINRPNQPNSPTPYSPPKVTSTSPTGKGKGKVELGSREINEIVDDKILHDLAHVYLDFVQSYIELKSTTHAHEVLLPVIYTVIGALGWPDGTVCRRGVWTATKLIPIMLDDTRYHQLLGREMIVAAIRSLASNRNPDHALELLGLVKDIYVQMKLVSDIPSKVLLELPHVTEESLQKLNQQLRANAHDVKAQRNLFKNLLQVGGIHIQNTRLQPSILDIPPGNFFAKVVEEKSSWVDKAPSLGLSNLFE